MRHEEQVKTGEEQNRAKILVVEDEPNMVVGLRDNFEFEGYEVITARDGVEGLGTTRRKWQKVTGPAICEWTSLS